MDDEGVRCLLIRDWVELENTPPAERPPVRLERWRYRARCLAAASGSPAQALQEELQGAARELAAERRRELELELARDLATVHALGREPTPPWHRRLRALAAVSGIAPDVLEATVRQAAGEIRVMVCG